MLSGLGGGRLVGIEVIGDVISVVIVELGE
ncbi:MAG: hypothetical protein RIS92_1149 [Verrucomicrobiota bacterium]